MTRFAKEGALSSLTRVHEGGSVETLDVSSLRRRRGAHNDAHVDADVMDVRGGTPGHAGLPDAPGQNAYTNKARSFSGSRQVNAGLDPRGADALSAARVRDVDGRDSAGERPAQTQHPSRTDSGDSHRAAGMRGEVRGGGQTRLEQRDRGESSAPSDEGVWERAEHSKRHPPVDGPAVGVMLGSCKTGSPKRPRLTAGADDPNYRRPDDEPGKAEGPSPRGVDARSSRQLEGCSASESDDPSGIRRLRRWPSGLVVDMLRSVWSLVLFGCAVLAAVLMDHEAQSELEREALEHFGGER